MLFLFFTLTASAIFPLDVEHTVGYRLGAEVNTTLGARSIYEIQYQILFNKRWQISPGFLLGAGKPFLTAYHLELGYNQLFTEPLSFHLKFLNRSYHDLSVAENSIIPFLSWRRRHFEADFGFNARFTNFGPKNLDLIFYYPNDLFQPHFMFRVAGYLAWENPDIRLGLELKNTEWNYAGNSYEISYHIDASYQVSKQWSLNINLGTTPSGISGLSVLYNRFIIVAGARYQI